ncbi:MAG: hypothetical protein AAF533_19925 [Acidobacteriota bacterium]
MPETVSFAQLEETLADARRVLSERAGLLIELLAKTASGRAELRRHQAGHSSMVSERSWHETGSSVRVTQGDALLAAGAAVRPAEAWELARSQLVIDDTADERVEAPSSPGGPEDEPATGRLVLSSERTPADGLDAIEACLSGGDALEVSLFEQELQVGRVRQRRLTSRGARREWDEEIVHWRARARLHADGDEAEVRLAWSGREWNEALAAALVERVRRAAEAELSGLTRPVSWSRIWLAPQVVAEVTAGWAPTLLGLTGQDASIDGGSVVVTGLRLVEDAVDEAGRSPRVDDAGRGLRRRVILDEEGWRRPALDDLPTCRPGFADTPGPGWLRLSWESDAAQADEELAAALGTGPRCEEVVTLGLDPVRLTWRGLASGTWLVDGEPHHRFTSWPLRLELGQLLRALRAGGPRPGTEHGSGRVRGVDLLVSALDGA